MKTLSKFPTRALLLGVLWVPLAIGVLALCFALGWGGMDYWQTQTFIALAVVLGIGLVQELVAISTAARSLAANRDTRTARNVSVFVCGVVVAAILVILFSFAAIAAWKN